MDIVINDTNIFLDLYDVDLLHTFFQLPVQVHTVDFVVDEIKGKCPRLSDRHSSWRQLGEFPRW